MSAHVLLNLLNELGKRDKMRSLSSILSLFRNEFNKFNNTRARMLYSYYHMTLRIVSEYDQEIPQSQTADTSVAPRGRAAQPPRDTRKTN